LFLAFILYETDDAIQEVVRYLEEKSIETRYHLKFGRTPEHLPLGMSSTLLINQLKNSFPCLIKVPPPIKFRGMPVQILVMMRTINILLLFSNIPTSKKRIFMMQMETKLLFVVQKKSVGRFYL
jgi:hypothetical protein